MYTSPNNNYNFMMLHICIIINYYNNTYMTTNYSVRGLHNYYRQTKINDVCNYINEQRCITMATTAECTQ